MCHLSSSVRAIHSPFSPKCALPLGFLVTPSTLSSAVSRRRDEVSLQSSELLTTLGHLGGYGSATHLTLRRKGFLLRGAPTLRLIVTAQQGGRNSPRRLVDVVRAIPRISKAYFKSPFRRALYGGIALLGGFYVAQTISLSFGALGVNDVIAAAMCVLFSEYVTRFYYTRQQAPIARTYKADLGGFGSASGISVNIFVSVQR